MEDPVEARVGERQGVGVTEQQVDGRAIPRREPPPALPEHLGAEIDAPDLDVDAGRRVMGEMGQIAAAADADVEDPRGPCVHPPLRDGLHLEPRHVVFADLLLGGEHRQGQSVAHAEVVERSEQLVHHPDEGLEPIHGGRLEQMWHALFDRPGSGTGAAVQVAGVEPAVPHRPNVAERAVAAGAAKERNLLRRHATDDSRQITVLASSWSARTRASSQVHPIRPNTPAASVKCCRRSGLPGARCRPISACALPSS